MNFVNFVAPRACSVCNKMLPLQKSGTVRGSILSATLAVTAPPESAPPVRKKQTSSTSHLYETDPDPSAWRADV